MPPDHADPRRERPELWLLGVLAILAVVFAVAVAEADVSDIADDGWRHIAGLVVV